MIRYDIADRILKVSVCDRGIEAKGRIMSELRNRCEYKAITLTLDSLYPALGIEQVALVVEAQESQAMLAISSHTVNNNPGSLMVSSCYRQLAPALECLRARVRHARGRRPGVPKFPFLCHLTACRPNARSGP
jgi:hypothetical protein